jgi:hypothetical protein
MFCALEGPAAFWRNCPWDTFSRSIWDAQAKWDFLTVIVAALFGILASHLLRFKGIQEGDRKAPIKVQIQQAKVRRAQAILENAAS